MERSNSNGNLEEADGNGEENGADGDGFSTKKRSLDEVDGDALLMIIERLPMKKRFRLEMLNERWRTLCYKSWSSVKTLEMSWFEDISGEEFFPWCRGKLSTEAAKAVWKRCGRHVLSVSFQHTLGQSWDGLLGGGGSAMGLEEILEDWVGYCPQCKYLDLSQQRLNPLVLQLLCCFKKLEALNLKRASFTNPSSNDSVSALLQELGRLKMLNLNGISSLSVSWLRDLPVTVERLDISACYGIDLNTNLLICARSALKELRRSHFPAQMPFSPELLPAMLPNLTLLDLSYPDFYGTTPLQLYREFSNFPTVAQLPN